MTEKTISTIAKELLQYKGKCNVDVNSISKQLMSLDDNLNKYQRQKQIKRDQPMGA